MRKYDKQYKKINVTFQRAQSEYPYRQEKIYNILWSSKLFFKLNKPTSVNVIPIPM